MTTSDPDTTPAVPQPDPGRSAPDRPGAGTPEPQQPGPWTPQQPGVWARQQQAGPWVPPQGGASAVPGSAPGGPKKWLRIGVPIAVAGVVGSATLAGWLGWGDPEVGDCVQMQGATSFDVVDCGAAEAEYRIVGIEDEEMTQPAFMADADTCARFESTEVALWIGELETEPGTVYCAEPTGVARP